MRNSSTEMFVKCNCLLMNCLENPYLRSEQEFRAAILLSYTSCACVKWVEMVACHIVHMSCYYVNVLNVCIDCNFF